VNKTNARATARRSISVKFWSMGIFVRFYGTTGVFERLFVGRRSNRSDFILIADTNRALFQCAHQRPIGRDQGKLKP
jgi:hypothetical protein